MWLRWRTALWLLLSTVLVPALLTVSVGILILVFYRESWDVALGVLVLCFAAFAIAGSSATVFLLRRSAQLAQLQAEFIANISHDFRTPLTSIRMFVETLRSGRVKNEEERERCLELLGQEAERMERLVQRVLTFRQVEETGGAFHLSPQVPDELLTRAMRPFQLDAGMASRLKEVVEPHLPSVLADADAFVEAIRNLVSNALKYSPDAGSVVVSVHSDGEGIAFSVRDLGPVIPKVERKRIFKRFYRAPGNAKPGSGLGLAIAQQVARGHGGTLDLKSSRGAGNVFTLWLPVVAHAASSNEAVVIDGQSG